jgi:hypothetical protein
MIAKNPERHEIADMNLRAGAKNDGTSGLLKKKIMVEAKPGELLFERYTKLNYNVLRETMLTARHPFCVTPT